MMQNPAASEDEGQRCAEGQGQGGCARWRRASREQRKEWRKRAREMGWFPGRWRSMSQSDSETEKSGPSDNERAMEQGETPAEQDGAKKMRGQMQEKRTKLRELIRDLDGVHPWMFRVLAQQIYGTKADQDEAGKDVKTAESDEKMGRMGKKKQKFVEGLQQIGAQPWMFRVLANQRFRNAETAKQQSPTEAKAVATAPEEADAAVTEVPVQTEKAQEMAADTNEMTEAEAGAQSWPWNEQMRSRRWMWRQMAEQMGWIPSGASESEATSASDGEQVANEQEQPAEREERKKAEKEWKKMKEMMREMHGERHHHHRHPHHHRHAPGDVGADHQTRRRHRRDDPQ